MIIDHIKNSNQEEISATVDRSLPQNEFLNISAININPCAIDNQYISRVIDEHGYLFKWKNLKSGYSYWLFDLVHEDNLKTKDLGSADLSNLNQPKSKKDFEHFGFSGMKNKKMINAVPITENEIDEVETILLSHEVYLYKGERFSGDVNWQRIKIADGSLKVERNRIDSYQIEIEVEFPKIRTQNLLWQ